jgi:hypothetical protein
MLKIKKVHGNAKLPERGTAYAAGYDLFTCVEQRLDPGEISVLASCNVLCKSLNPPFTDRFVHTCKKYTRPLIPFSEIKPIR